MHTTRTRSGEALIEGMRLCDIADRFGTPTLVYSRAYIEARVRTFLGAFKALRHLPCYAVKANNNLSLLSLMARLDLGFDVVSGNELERVLRAGGDASKVVFSGVGKLAEELDFALEVGILSINIESRDECELLAERAALCGIEAPVSLRVNPDIRVSTHPYIATGDKSAKFGVSCDEAHSLLRQAGASNHLRPVGLACHLGSQITDSKPLDEACAALLALAATLEDEGIVLSMLDLGGGYGVPYHPQESEFDLAAYGQKLGKRLSGSGYTLVTEPGRWLMANAGVLLTRVIRTKSAESRKFAVVDAAMNDLLRPSLYQAYHQVERAQVAPPGTDTGPWEIVGPICETADTLASGRELPVASGDLLSLQSCGAYVSVLASNYNARDRVAEVLVEGDTVRLIRHRECLNDQLALELPLLEDASSGESGPATP